MPPPGKSPFGGGPKGAAKKTAPAKAATKVADPTDEDEDGDEPETLSARTPASDPFADPSGGGGDYKFTEFNGELLLVRPDPDSIGETMDTEIGNDASVLRVDVVRLDNENEYVEDLLIFQKALLRTFTKVAKGPNNWCIGRLGQGTAKRGKSAPWIFVKAEPEEKELALKVAKELKLDL